MSKAIIRAGTSEKIRAGSSQGGVIFKMGTQWHPCKVEVVVSFRPSSLTSAGHRAPAALSGAFSLPSCYKFCGTNQHLPIRK